VILEEINQHEDDPGDLVHDLFTETLWPGHPLGRPILGTKQSIQGAGRTRCGASIAALRRRQRGLVAVGTCGTMSCSSRCRAHGAGRRAGHGRAPEPGDRATPPARPALAGQQAQDRAGPHLPRDQRPVADRPDRFARWGGEQRARRRNDSRLFQEVREKRDSRTACTPTTRAGGGRVLRLRRYHARVRRRCSRSCGPSSRTWPTRARSHSSARRAI
jgi:hypothetical protein